MALKDRFRRAIGRPSDRSSSSSSASNASTRPPTGTTTPNEHPENPLTAASTRTNGGTGTVNNQPPPSLTLTKTSSKLGLSKTLTWRSVNKPTKDEKKEQKALKAWEKEDAEEWKAPKDLRPGRRKDQMCQDTLRAFDFKKFERESFEQGRTRSICSGISPSQSRAGSVDDGANGLQRVLSGGRKRSSGAGKLSQEVNYDEAHPTTMHKQSVGTVQEE